MYKKVTLNFGGSYPVQCTLEGVEVLREETESRRVWSTARITLSLAW